eukprot:gene25787-31142_t
MEQSGAKRKTPDMPSLESQTPGVQMFGDLVSGNNAVTPRLYKVGRNISCQYDQIGVERFFLLNISRPVECDTPELLHCPNITLNDSLVVQLRAGDIFGDHPHRAYNQPPLVMYEEIINSRPWRQVIFVSSKEDYEHTNPIWLHYKFMQKEIDEERKAKKDGKVILPSYIFQSSNSVEVDINLLRCAHYVVAAHSTMKTFYADHGPFLKELWVPDLHNADGYDSLDSPFELCRLPNRRYKCHKVEVLNFVHGQWKASPMQRAEMLMSRNVSLRIT